MLLPRAYTCSAFTEHLLESPWSTNECPLISHLSPRGISRIEPAGVSPKDLGRQEQHHPVIPPGGLPLGGEHVMVDRGHRYRRGAILVVKAMRTARVAERLFGTQHFSREDAVFYDRGQVGKRRKV